MAYSYLRCRSELYDGLTRRYLALQRQKEGEHGAATSLYQSSNRILQTISLPRGGSENACIPILALRIDHDKSAVARENTSLVAHTISPAITIHTFIMSH
jgi:hypothetical protein